MARWDPSTIDEADFLPEPFRTADQAALLGQRQALRWYRGLILMLVLAAAMGVVATGKGPAPLVSLAAFLVGCFFWSRLRAANPQAHWYQARAAAESVKTLAWAYAVRARPFAGPAESLEVDEDYRALVSQLLVTFGDYGVFPPQAAPEITEGMRRLRAESLVTRRTFYLRLRVEQQRTWYLARAQAYESQSVTWELATGVLMIVGAAGAVAQATGVLSVSVFAACAAAAAAVIAWTELMQLRPLVLGYQLAARELDLVWGRLSTLELGARDAEAEWARLAGDVESAVAREHTGWRSRRAFPR
ncbi:hypothetical protein C7C46_06460 [Streptomyces tateyamensis]|uniref:DUF4231 domain-containing protein n=1 Tax=Streptomyces tateyamensis TaxID=565073 RepID=A0A2V4NXK9_9ACTN|nr:DUF4231 domain-containing protein [Streptomyces tateyamensis]PYC85384.1 hypothetical protein C7C46_06460 [Streptomyces tateyamensis]